MKDYIQNPKESGYMSLHLVLEVPYLLSEGPKPIHVEVQLRTIAMDFWASLEHKLKYKQIIMFLTMLKKNFKNVLNQLLKLI